MLLASTYQFPDHEGAIFSGSGIGESLRGMFDTSASRGGNPPFRLLLLCLDHGQTRSYPGARTPVLVHHSIQEILLRHMSHKPVYG